MTPKIYLSWLRVLLLLLTLSIGNNGTAQDIFFTHLYGGESVFNPALVGYRGSTALTAKYKNEWLGSDVPAYKSAVFTYEESLPCSILDYGLSIVADQEGEGFLQTVQFGGQFAGAIPMPIGKSAANLRIGGGFQFGQKRIDFSRLTFSDELDPKFGAIFPTSFAPPGDNHSLWFMSPSVGASYRIRFHRRIAAQRSPTLHFGAATHNFFRLGKGNLIGGEESILQTGAVLPSHITAFAHFELVPYMQRRQYVTVKFMSYYRQQQNIDAITLGVRLGLSRHFGFSTLVHFNETQQEGTNTNWVTYQFDLNQILGDNRWDIGFAYSRNFSGLRNQVSGIFELTTTFHFSTSPLCGASIKADSERGSTICPTSNLTKAKQKLYEHIWYE